MLSDKLQLFQCCTGPITCCKHARSTSSFQSLTSSQQQNIIRPILTQHWIKYIPYIEKTYRILEHSTMTQYITDNHSQTNNITLKNVHTQTASPYTLINLLDCTNQFYRILNYLITIIIVLQHQICSP